MASNAPLDASNRPVSDDGLLDKEQLAAKLGVSVHWVSKMATARKIPFTKVGKHIRFAPHHFDAIVAMGEQPVTTAPTRAQVRQRRAAAPRPRRSAEAKAS